MGGQAESSTQLNQGAAGDLVRDLAMSINALVLKQQVVSVGDPVNPLSLQSVDLEGRIESRDVRLLDVMERIANELTRLRLVIEVQTPGSDTGGADTLELGEDPEVDAQ